MMKMEIGPYSRDRIVLCSADASPERSQRQEPGYAGHFFPGAKWVGRMRNAASNLRCKFVILTTAHGMVGEFDTISPYDLHIYADTAKVERNWRRTIPLLIGNGQYDLLLFYAGGCPKEAYLEALKPILHENQISLLTFGRANVCDMGRVEDIVELLTTGTDLDQLRSILKYPQYLEFHPAPRYSQ